MAAGADGHGTLQSAVLSCFASILGGDKSQLRAAEEELQALEVAEKFGVVLAELTVASNSPVAYRQLASVILKQYVQSHWSNVSEKFCEPMPQEETKEAIRRLLPVGLADPLSKIRATVAYAVSAVASWDWPENWPNLFDQLMAGLGSGSPELVHGTMRVLVEFCQDVADTQMPQVAPVILPQLLSVISQPQVYSARTRCRAVNIFSVLSGIVNAMSDTFPEMSRTLICPFLAGYITQFVQILTSHSEADSDPGLRKEVILALSNLIRSYTSTLLPHLLTLVTPVWNILVNSTDLYLRTVVNSYDQFDELCDSDGEKISFESVLFAIFDFITALLDITDSPNSTSSLAHLFSPILPDLIFYLISLMQITTEQASSWESDVSEYVAGDESELSFSVRLAAYDLLETFIEELPLQVQSANSSSILSIIIAAVDRHLSSTPQSPSNPCWWQVHEACLFALNLLVDSVKHQPNLLDCQMFASSVLLPDLVSGVSPLLTGRCLLLAGKMATLLKNETVQQCLQATVTGLQSTQHPVVRLCAAKTSYHICSELVHSNTPYLLSPVLPYLLSELCDLASESISDIMTYVLDTLQLVCKVDPSVTASAAQRLVPLSLALFLRYAHDPEVDSCLEELFQVLADNDGCRPLLQQKMAATAVDILTSAETQIPLGLVASVLDILVIIVRSSSSSLPLSFITDVYPVVVKRVLNSEDSAILQNGGECVRAFVSIAADQLATWTDSMGTSGLQYAVQIGVHLLDPSRPESSAAFVGKLIIVFVKKLGSSLGSHLELLLRSVLSKMQRVQTTIVLQSLITVFAHLSMTQLELVLSFLSQVPDPTGRSALEFVLIEWCDKHSMFYGVYEARVSTLALCHLLSHYVTTGDRRLGNITIEEEVTSSMSTGIQTRSQKAASLRQWTKVPLPVKLVKLLIRDLQMHIETDDCEGEVGDSWSAEASAGGDTGVVESLEAALLDTNAAMMMGEEEEDEREENDPDLKDEPILKIDIHAHLTQYLLTLSQQHGFSSFINLLSPLERNTLQTIGIAC